MDISGLWIDQEIVLDCLISVHYYEYTRDFASPKVTYSHWEFLDVDNGEVEVTVENATYLLRKGDIIFHKPEETHSVSV